MENPQRLAETLARFDAVNAEDPTSEMVDGAPQPKELLYARRMTAWLGNLEPAASEALQLAARAQHIQRWAIPRRDFPMDRTGYLRWRTTLYQFHADTAGAIMAETGYAAETIERVQSLLRKQRLKRDAEAQCLEDVACLVFLQSYFADFSAQHDEDKIVNIVRKTWRKMSPRGHDAALGIEMTPAAKAIVVKALDQPQEEAPMPGDAI